MSYFQGDADFASMKKNGITFAILRSSFRDATDAKFFEYVEGCRKAGIEIPGIYHFLYGLNIEEVKAEARLAVQNAKDAKLPKSTIIFSDFEYDTITKARTKGVTLGRAECNSHTIAFCETVESLGYKAGIYTNLDYYKNMYEKSTLDRWVLWLADYTGEPDYPCSFQQYTSHGSIPGVLGYIDLDYDFQNEGSGKTKTEPSRSRNAVVSLVNSWIGKGPKEIIDIYNSYSGIFPRGTKMQYDWAWCAATWSALAIKLGYTDIMPIEISCYYIIEEAKKMGVWVESDAYVPQPGDAVLYDWNDDGVGDNMGVPQHIGTVTFVDKESGYFVVTEGNYDNTVKKRTVSINGKFIRGFITPRYTDDEVVNTSSTNNNGTVTESTKKKIKVIANEVIAGLWGNGDARKTALEASGYNYEKVQAKVNEILNTPKETKDLQTVEATAKAQVFDKSLSGTYITSADLYCRNDAGTNKKALCLIPKGTKVNNYGYYSVSNGVKWLYIQFTLNGIQYTGFSSRQYLTK